MRKHVPAVFVALACAASLHAAAPAITFEENQVVVQTTPGNSIALTVEGSGLSLIGGFTADSYGIVRRPIFASSTMNAIAVNLATGEWSHATTGSTQRLAMPEAMIVRGPNGAASQLILPDAITTVLWVRSGGDAWGLPRTEPDEDETSGNGVRFARTANFDGLRTFDFTTPPAGFSPGDLFFALGGTSRWMAGTVGTITTAPGVVAFSTSAALAETEGSAKSIVLMRTGGSQGPASVRYRTDSAGALPGIDYTPIDTVVTFADGEVLKKIPLVFPDDGTYAASSAVDLKLDSEGAALGAGRTRRVTITTNDPPPSIAFGAVPVSVQEKNAPWTLQVPVTLSGSTRTPAIGRYGIHRAGAPSSQGEVVFAPGQTSASIPLPIAGNTVTERHSTYRIAFSGGVDVAPPAGISTAIEVKDDDLPQLTANDVTVSEQVAVLSVVLQLVPFANDPVSVSWSTADGTAKAGLDYEQRSGTISSVEANPLIAIPLIADHAAESTETFYVDLTTVRNATLARQRIAVTIHDDDRVGRIAVSDAAVMESTGAPAYATFDVTLAEALAAEVRVSFATSDVTAHAGADYVARSGVLTFAPGQTTQPVVVEITGDRTVEPDERFRLTLANPVNATLERATAEATIRDDDGAALPLLSVFAGEVTEGTGTNRTAAFAVRLSPASSEEVRVSYATADRTAAAGSDYGATSGVLTFAPGETSKHVVVPVYGDALVEPDERFVLTLSNPSGAAIAVDRAEAAILDDDLPNAGRLSVSDVTVLEPTGHDATVVFHVMLAQPAGAEVRVAYETSDLTALAGADYAARSGVLIFAPGVTSMPVAVTILGDGLVEPDERFRLTLRDPSGAAIARASAEATIRDDDAGSLPSLSISPASVIEGTGANSEALFAVTLSATSPLPVSVVFATSELNAAADLDYATTIGTLVFAPGETSKTIAVSVHGDALAETEERFRVTLSNAVNARIDVDSAEGTIADDDVPKRRAARH